MPSDPADYRRETGESGNSIWEEPEQEEKTRGQAPAGVLWTSAFALLVNGAARAKMANGGLCLVEPRRSGCAKRRDGYPTRHVATLLGGKL
jgi:hypothetical protein